MAGHSKWSNIKHRKGAQDQKRGKVFTKIIKEITISARLNGGDINSNPRLRKAISNAKSNNMPSGKIERAIKKGIGELEGVFYEEITYEAYGPYGVAIIMDVITDNKNRSVADIRHILSKYNGKLTENGSVSWMFEKKGHIIISSNGIDENTLFEAIINAGAEDLQNIDDTYLISTAPEQLLEIRDNLEDNNYIIQSSELEMVPQTLQRLANNEINLVISLLQTLDDNDDVNKLYSNFDYFEN